MGFELEAGNEADRATTTTRWPEKQGNVEVAPATGGFELPAGEPKKPSYAEDMAKSAGTQGVFGLGDIAGLPGTLGTFLKEGASYVGRKGLEAADYLGMLPGEHTPETLPKAIDEGFAKAFSAPPGRPVRERGARGDVPGSWAWPSGEEIEKELREKVPALDYKPKTKPGEYVGDISRMATSSLAGGPGKTLAEKALIGAAGGAGAATAADVAKVAGLGDYEGAARLVGALLTTGGANNFVASTRAFTGRSKEAEAQLLKALQDDFRDGTAKMTPQQLQEAIQYGHTPSVHDMAGARTTELLAKMGGMSPAELGRFNAAIAARNDMMRTANADYITRTFNITDRAGAEAASMKAAQKGQIDAVYDVARNDPSANFVASQRLTELEQAPLVKQAMRDTADLAGDPKLNIRPPSEMAPSLPGQPTVHAPGNLNFWDHVKRNLDGMYNAEKDPYRKSIIDSYRKEIAAEVDKQVSAYGTARATAAEAFGEQDALKAGTKFAMKPDTYTTQDITKALTKFTPEERDLFVRGVGDALLMKAQNSNPTAFVKFITNSETGSRLRAALGDARYDQLHGHARMVDLLGNAAGVQGIAQKPSWITGHVGVTAAIASVLPEVAYMTMGMAPGVAAKVIAGIAFDKGLQMVRHSAEKRIAPEVVRLAMSENPADIQRLGRLLQSNPAAGAFFDRVTSSLTELGSVGVRSQSGMQEAPRPQRKAGGRIGTIDHMSIAAGLIRAAEKAKKGHGKTTEPLLNQPDEAITKALAIADNALS